MLEPGLLSLLHRLWPLRHLSSYTGQHCPPQSCSDPRTSSLPLSLNSQAGHSAFYLLGLPLLHPDMHAALALALPVGEPGSPASRAPSQPAGRARSSSALLGRTSPMCISVNFIQFCPHQTKSGCVLCLAYINKDRLSQGEGQGDIPGIKRRTRTVFVFVFMSEQVL